MESRKKRKICVVTGTRAEYGLLKSVMTAIKKSPKLELQIIVTGMHLSSIFGMTTREIKTDGFKINAKVKMTPNEDTSIRMATSIGGGINGIAKVLKRLRPDILVVLGDRVEALAASIAAAYMNIVVAHIHGGDSAGAGLDEYARHAITKISHLHFPATKLSAKRIIKMGEDPQKVFVVGAPGLDSILKEETCSKEKIIKKYKLDQSKPILLVLQHSVTTEVKDAEDQIRQTMEAIKELSVQTIVIYPNSDAGGRKIIKVIEKYKDYPFIKIYQNISREKYLGLMNIASVMIGNSSGGIIEAPSLYLPVVNIGTRQDGRERAGNTIDVGYKKKEIKKAILKAFRDKEFRKRIKKTKNPYGDGNAGEKIAGILSKIKIDKNLFKKQITY